MLARLLYLILLTLVARLVFRALAEVFGSGSSSGSRRVGDPGGRHVLVKGRMVRDPVCGLNVPEDRAIVAVVEGETHYFCSEQCRGAFTGNESRRQKRARA